jgi:CheY-like chemotaxis protein
MSTRIASSETSKPLALIVEDEASVRELICEVLSDEGIETISLETADEGFAYLQQNAVDLAIVVLDVRTPGRLDGLELAGLAEAQWPQLPIILTSGYTGRNIPLPKSATFLPKPWSIDALQRAVNEALANASHH